jgi:GAF domain-containing protein
MSEKVFIFDEEEEQMTATARSSLELLFHVSRELATALDLHTVLQRVLKLSLDSVGGISGSIIVLDDKRNPIDSAIIHSGQVYNHTTRQLRATLEKGLAGWVVRNTKPALIRDTSTDSRWTKRPDDAPDRTGAKSAVAAPLMAREKLAGVITLVHPVPGTFNEQHLALVQAIADQAGIAVLNARLYEESQRQARVMTALAESAVAITAAMGTEDILQRILEQINQAMQVEAVSLSLINTEKNILEIKASTGPVSTAVIGVQLKMGQGVAGWVAKEGKGIIVPNVKESPLFIQK